MGSFAVAKGKRAERSVASALNPILESICIQVGIPVMALRRNLKQTQQGGHDLDGLDWIAIEIKHHAEIKSKLNGWWEQTLRQAGPMTDARGVVTYMKEPVLIYKANGSRWHVRMFARLDLDPENNRRLRVVADISWDAFLVWFEKKCRVMVEKDKKATIEPISMAEPGLFP